MKDMSRRKMQVAIVLVAFCAMVFVLARGEEGLLRLWDLHRDHAKVQDDLQAAKELNRDLRREVDRLTNDEEYIEQAVRDTWDYVEPGETVYRFETPSSSDR